MMGCDLYGATDLPGHKGLCRANPGTAYGPQKIEGKKVPGAVMTQTGQIIPDPTRAKNDQPWKKFFDTARSCSAKSGYYEVPDSGPNGATFGHKAADAVRKFPNMSQDRVSFSVHAGKPGTLCVKADQPSIREGIIRKIRGDQPFYIRYTPLRWLVGSSGECPTGLDDKQCNALATSMEALRPPEPKSMLWEFVFLLMAFTIGPDAYHYLKNWIKNRKGGGGDGPGGSGGGITPEQMGRAMAEFVAAQNAAAPEPKVEAKTDAKADTQPTNAQAFTADSFLDGALQMGGKSPVAAAVPGPDGVKAPTVKAPIPVVPAPAVVPRGAPVYIPRPALVPAIP